MCIQNYYQQAKPAYFYWFFVKRHILSQAIFFGNCLISLSLNHEPTAVSLYIGRKIEKICWVQKQTPSGAKRQHFLDIDSDIRWLLQARESVCI